MSSPLSAACYRLHSYVCGAGCVKPSPFEGWASFTLIYQQRPDNCRFAIAEVPTDGSVLPKGPWVCWDLYDDELMSSLAQQRVAANDGAVAAPWPKWQGPGADPLIMKAMALYDRD